MDIPIPTATLTPPDFAIRRYYPPAPGRVQLPVSIAMATTVIVLTILLLSRKKKPIFTEDYIDEDGNSAMTEDENIELSSVEGEADFVLNNQPAITDTSLPDTRAYAPRPFNTNSSADGRSTPGVARQSTLVESFRHTPRPSLVSPDEDYSLSGERGRRLKAPKHPGYKDTRPSAPRRLELGAMYEPSYVPSLVVPQKIPGDPY